MKFTHYNRFFLKRNRLGSFINILNITKHKFCVLVWFIFVSLTDFMRNNSPYMAAGMAYWTLFSLFPLALAGISIIGYFFSTPSEQEIVGLIKGIGLVAKKIGVSDVVKGGGYRSLVNVGENGGQEVPHLHFHIFGGEKIGKMVS